MGRRCWCLSRGALLGLLLVVGCASLSWAHPQYGNTVGGDPYLGLLELYANTSDRSAAWNTTIMLSSSHTATLTSYGSWTATAYGAGVLEYNDEMIAIELYALGANPGDSRTMQPSASVTVQLGSHPVRAYTTSGAGYNDLVVLDEHTVVGDL